MTAQEAKKELYELRFMDARIDGLIRHRDAIALYPSQACDGVHVKASQSSSAVERAVLALARIESRLDQEIDRLVDARDEFTYTISLVKDTRYKAVLELRYMAGRSWDDIAGALGYDRTHVWRLHGWALQAYADARNEGNH